MSETIYDRAYRKMHPRLFPFSAWERQRELSDLWPADQEKFKRVVDAIIDVHRLPTDVAV